MKKILLVTLIITTVAAFIWGINWQYSHPESYEVGGFQYIEQPDGITCGPTSVTMLLKRYGKEVTLDEVKKQTKTEWLEYHGEPIGMTSPEYLPIALKHFGIDAKMLRGDLERLKYFVSQDRPPIVLLRSGDTTWHYVVVIGYTSDTIITADPASGSREVMKVEHFQGAWDFKTTMSGRSVVQKCERCGGTGRWLDFDLGPLSRCEFCDGTGISPDTLVMLLKTAEVHPRTMIVPRIHTEAK